MATSWSTPKTWSTGNVLTATDLNTYVRDNTSWLGTDKPLARVFNSAAISIANNTNTAVTFDSERFDNQGMHSTSSNTSRLTVPTGMGGKFLIGGHIEFAGNASGQRDILIQVNGSTVIAYDRVGPNGAVSWKMSLTTMYALSAADYVELLVFQNSGGALNLDATGNYTPEFWAMWMSN